MTRRVVGIAWLALPAAWIAAAHAGPLLLLVRISLSDRFPNPAPGWSLAAYRAFTDDPATQAALGRSVALAAAATAISLLVAFPLAFHVALRVPPAQRARRLVLLAAPFWTGEVVRLFALLLLLSNRGPVNALLQAAGMGPASLLYGPGSVLSGTVYTVLLSMILPLYAALDRLPPGVLDAAADLGAGPWTRMRTVVLPLAAPGIAAGCGLCFLSSLGLLAAPALLGGAGAPVFATLIAGMFAGASGRWPAGAALGLVLLVTGLAAAMPLAVAAKRRAAA